VSRALRHTYSIKVARLTFAGITLNLLTHFAYHVWYASIYFTVWRQIQNKMASISMCNVYWWLRLVIIMTMTCLSQSSTALDTDWLVTAAHHARAALKCSAVAYGAPFAIMVLITRMPELRAEVLASSEFCYHCKNNSNNNDSKNISPNTDHSSSPTHFALWGRGPLGTPWLTHIHRSIPYFIGHTRFRIDLPMIAASISLSRQVLGLPRFRLLSILLVAKWELAATYHRLSSRVQSTSMCAS